VQANLGTGVFVLIRGKMSFTFVYLEAFCMSVAVDFLNAWHHCENPT